MYNISLAPMVDRTDIHFRSFIQMLSEDIKLYTEMITTQAIINGNTDRLFRHNYSKNEIVLQIASSSLSEVKEASKIISRYNFDEINLNVGCPSDRVSQCNMGAYLMSNPKLVRDMAYIIKNETGKKVSIKNRIGIDGKGILENDRLIHSLDELLEFIDITNVEKYTIHARIAILKGLNPKENRIIPPLDYNMVYKVKEMRPKLFIEINGGIKTIEDIKNHHKKVDGVMIGREFYDNPMLANKINVLYNKKTLTYVEILEKIFYYVKQMEKDGESPHYFLRHTLGLFHSTNYSKLWKKNIGNSKVTSNELLEFLEIIRYNCDIQV